MDPRRPPSLAFPDYAATCRGGRQPPPPTSTSTSSSSPGERRCHSCCRRCASAAFGNLGVCALVVAYTVLGGLAFLALEGGGGSVGGVGGADETNGAGGLEKVVVGSVVGVGGSGASSEGRGSGSGGGGSGRGSSAGATAAVTSSSNGGLIHGKFADHVAQLRNRTVERLWSITEGLNILYERNWTRLATQEVVRFQESVVSAMRTGIQGVGGTNSQPSHHWTFASSLLYSLTLITTIGYGSVTPRSTWGKLVTVLYALVGIPLMLLYLSSVGDFLARTFRRFYGRLCRCRSRTGVGGNAARGKVPQRPIDSLPDGPVKPPHVARAYPGSIGPSSGARVPIWLCLLLIVGYILGGACLFARLEGWSLLEGAFFCFSALGTIGFGDLVPGGVTGRGGSDRDPSLPGSPSLASSSPAAAQASLLASAAYILVGMALIAMCFNLIQDEIVVVARRLGRSVGMFRSGDGDGDDDDYDDDDMDSLSGHSGGS